MSFIPNLPKVKIFSDGASRGNPGPSAVAFMILSIDGKELKRCSKFIGIGTNNQAEYKALTYALEAAFDFTSLGVVCYLDSELVAKQLNEEYRVRDPVLKALWLEVNRIKRKFRHVSFEYVPRTNLYVQQVDEMAKKILGNVENSSKTGS